MFFSFWCSLAMSNFPAHPPSYPRPCYHPQKPKPFPLFIKKKQHQHISTLSTINPINPMDLPLQQKKQSCPPLDRTKKLMARAVPCFLAILGSVKVTGCRVSTSQIVRAYNFLGKQAMLWVGHAGHFGGRWVACIFCECLKVWGHIFMKPCRKG